MFGCLNMNTIKINMLVSSLITFPHRFPNTCSVVQPAVPCQKHASLMPFFSVKILPRKSFNVCYYFAVAGRKMIIDYLI